MMAFIHGETRDERKARLLAEGIEDTGPSGTMGDLMRSLGFMPKFTNETSGATTTGFSNPLPSNPAEVMYQKEQSSRSRLLRPLHQRHRLMRAVTMPWRMCDRSRPQPLR